MTALSPNTHRLWLMATVTLPNGETPDTQDASLLMTGGDFDPWPGVQIHDVLILCHRPMDAEAPQPPTSAKPRKPHEPRP